MTESMPTPKFQLGDEVFAPGLDSTIMKHPCPDCDGSGTWTVQSATGARSPSEIAALGGATRDMDCNGHYIVQRRNRDGYIVSIACAHCGFYVRVQHYFRRGDKSGSPKYCRSRAVMVKHLHAEHRDKLSTGPLKDDNTVRRYQFDFDNETPLSTLLANPPPGLSPTHSDPYGTIGANLPADAQQAKERQKWRNAISYAVRRDSSVTETQPK